MNQHVSSNSCKVKDMLALPTHIFFLKIWVKGYKLRSASLRNFIHSPVPLWGVLCSNFQTRVYSALCPEVCHSGCSCQAPNTGMSAVDRRLTGIQECLVQYKNKVRLPLKQERSNAAYCSLTSLKCDAESVQAVLSKVPGLAKSVLVNVEG
jgi:hypothetical protein